MKKSILLVLPLLFCGACMTQKVELGNMATVDPSVKMKKMKKSQVLDFSRQKFNKRPDLQRAINAHLDDVYTIDNIIVEMSVIKGVPQPNRVAYLTGMLRQLGPTTVEKVDDKQLLVALDNDKANAVMTYRFFCLNKSTTMQAGGIVQFEPADQQKARSILTNLIKNLKFKEQ